MTLREWTAAAVEPTTGAEPPAVDDPVSVTVPGSPAAFADADAVAYRTTFPDPREGDDAIALLELEGVYANARIWVNGSLVGEHDRYFRPFRHAFVPDDTNDVVVECRRPTDRFGGIFDTDDLPAGTTVPGIWWGASVDGRPDPAILDVSLAPRLDRDEGTIDATVEVHATEYVDDRVRFSIVPDGFSGGASMERTPVEGDGHLTVEHAIPVRDPSLWWPRELGPQHRYRVRAKIGDDATEAVTGFREVDLDRDGVTVNGRTIKARGVNVLSGEADDVARALEANANLVRAHAHVPPADLHEAADVAGVLVWQDLPLTGPGGYDVEEARRLAEDVVAARDNHPSVAIYGVHDDPTEPLTGSMGGGTVGKYKFRWRWWRSSYQHSADERVGTHFPDARAVLPVAGRPWSDPDAAHLYPGWEYGQVDDIAWLLDRYPGLGRVVGEFGAGAYGTGPTDEAAGFDAKKHAAYVGSDDVERSQAYQADAIKTVAESLRRTGSALLCAYALRDADAAGMGVIDAAGAPKAGFAALSAAYEPVQVFAAAPGRRTTELVVVNDTGKPVSGTVTWTAGEDTGSVDVEVDALDRVTTEAVSAPGDADALELSFATGNGAVTNQYRLCRSVPAFIYHGSR